ncbi:hypothetical protein O9H85_30920 [Paenibacillus filicis]|uniref:Uncharacterized protein n=1 Tax=Paenibacillus gyeongsangnamensis TaxID=3388067 RepID=A0ABT4QIK6_9BACL|nr:hypothetical protein [Paenibacillus filicis]MCZ8516708.1 hypothetical protein [Paenibacillus filicis]
MLKKTYSKPAVIEHEKICFETGLSSCVCVADLGQVKVCVKPDGTWDPLP